MTLNWLTVSWTTSNDARVAVRDSGSAWGKAHGATEQINLLRNIHAAFCYGLAPMCFAKICLRLNRGGEGAVLELLVPLAGPLVWVVQLQASTRELGQLYSLGQRAM